MTDEARRASDLVPISKSVYWPDDAASTRTLQSVLDRPESYSEFMRVSAYVTLAFVEALEEGETEEWALDMGEPRAMRAWVKQLAFDHIRAENARATRDA